MKKIKCKWGFSIFFLSCCAFATTPSMPDSLKNVEISAAVGPSWANTSSTHLVVSPYETDSVLKSSVSNHPLWKLGVGYHFFVEQLQQRRFLNDLLVELNLYQSSATVKGSVWQYQFPQFNNYRFSNPITSTRLMVDAKPGLFTQNHISLYPILGIGAVWNDVTYSETVTGAGVAPNTRYSLNGTNNSNFAYDLGAGVRVDVTKHLSASLEYLYTHLGSMSSSRVSKNGDALQSAPTFNVYNQGVLLGVSWKI